MPYSRIADPFNDRRFLILLFAALFFGIATWYGYHQQPTRDPFSPEPSWTEWAWWKEPVERNAFRRLASIGSELYSIRFLEDGLHGWIVGGDGVILSTRNGGKKWAFQQSGTKEVLSSLHFLNDGLRGWVVGWDGTILSTNDGGQNWTKQNSGLQTQLYAVFFLPDGLRGWAAGWGGTLLSTVDGGTTWNIQKSGSTGWIVSVFFLEDGKRGWIVETGQALAKP